VVNENRKPLEDVRVACEICLREIPASEARIAEATDYVLYFCGLECYDKWRNQEDAQETV
jgi:hypothetical protein